MSMDDTSGQECDDAPTAMALDADETTTKRARWEAFAFVIATTAEHEANVAVANQSYGDEAAREHTYTVTVDAGGPIECTCPAFTYHCQPGEACKHMLAVAETEPVRLAALRSVAEDDGGADEPELVTDGGLVEADPDARPDDCTCLPRFEGLACFPCVREGFTTPNPDADVAGEEGE